MTAFFEPINVSATHIYHSALELSPLSSTIRKLHYHRRLTPFPRVEIGIPDSRDSSISIPFEFFNSEPATWSPCGQYVATLTIKGVEIRDALTFELVSTLKPITSSANPPSYSPDGRTLACVTAAGITVWDIQTGGVVKNIQCDLPCDRLVWSSDGGVLGILSRETINTYNVASGMALSSIRPESAWDTYFWAHDESFRVMTTSRSAKTTVIDIFEVWPTLTKIESFSVQLVQWSSISFSSTTYRISAYFKRCRQLLILDIQDSGKLLVENLYLHPDSQAFSPDGSRFAARGLEVGVIHIWNYHDGRYIQWRLFPLPGIMPIFRILFSPTSSSILVPFGQSLRLWNLDSPPTSTVARATHKHLDIFSRSGTHIASAHYQDSTITVTNPLSQIPFQFIDTCIKIAGLGLTGNVLLVQGLNPGVVVAWLLTEEGWVSNVSRNRRAVSSDSIWTMSTPPRVRLKFSVEGETGVIKYRDILLRIYNSTTGEVLDSAREPRFSGPWYSFSDNLQAKAHQRRNLPVQSAPPSDTAWGEGWLKDHQGKCLLWLPTEWRVKWRRNVEWSPDISTIKFKSQYENPVIIKLQ